MKTLFSIFSVFLVVLGLIKVLVDETAPGLALLAIGMIGVGVSAYKKAVSDGEALWATRVVKIGPRSHVVGPSDQPADQPTKPSSLYVQLAVYMAVIVGVIWLKN